MTGGQRIDLVGVKKEDLPGIWRDIGMPAGHAWGKSYRTRKSCIGIDYCRFGLGDSMGLAQRIERTFRAFSDSPGKMKLGTAGCPRNCSEALIKDFGAVAIGDDKWKIVVGGAGGSHVRKADLLCTVDGEDAVMQIAGRFMQFYREDAKFKERSYTWLERIRVARVRAVVVEDSEGWGERFDAEVTAAIAAYRDPWKDGETPKTENQFASLITVEHEWRLRRSRTRSARSSRSRPAKAAISMCAGRRSRSSAPARTRCSRPRRSAHIGRVRSPTACSAGQCWSVRCTIGALTC